MTVKIDRRGANTKERSKIDCLPILKPNLCLTLLHTQHLADLSSPGRSGTPVRQEEPFEVHELLRGDS